jgi:hypothetical protein
VRSGGPPISGNGKGPKHAPILGTDSARQEERKTNLKYALFFFTVAVLLIVARQLGKDASTINGQSTSMPNVQFDLSVQGTSGEVILEDRESVPGGYIVRFRLSNRGNHAVFYPVRPGTNALEGHVVYRTTAQSEWMVLPRSSTSPIPNAQEPNGQNAAWIELPPGGWVDGQFRDPGWSGGDHAYVVDLKLERSAKAIPLVSPPYHFIAN